METSQPVSLPVKTSPEQRPHEPNFRPSSPNFSGASQDFRKSPEGRDKKTRMPNVFDRIITFSLCALFFGLPFFFTGVTFQGAAFEKQIYFFFWVLVASVAWVAKGSVTGEMRIRRTPLDIPLLLFAVVYVASALLSVDRWRSFWGAFGDPSRGLLSILALIVAYYLIVSHFNQERLKWLLGSFLISGGLVTVWMFLAAMGVRFLPSAWESRVPLAPLGTLGGTMLFLSLLLPLFIAVLVKIQESSRTGGVFRTIFSATILLVVALALFTLLALSEYTPWWPTLFGFGIFLVYILAQIVRIPEKWSWLPMLTLVVLLASFMIGSNNFARVKFPTEAVPNVKLSWEVAKEGVKRNFFLGTGPATYSYVFSMYRPEEYNNQPFFTLRFFQGSGLGFEILPTLGVAGAFAFGVLFLSFIGVGLYSLSKDKEKNKLLSVGLWSASVMLLLGSMFLPMSAGLLLTGVLAVSLAVAVMLWESDGPEQGRYFNLSLKSSPQFALVLAFVSLTATAGVAFLFSFVGKALMADILVAQASSRQPITEDSAAKVFRAIGYMPKEGQYHMTLGQMYLNLAGREISKPEQDRDLDRAKQYLSAAYASATAAKTVMPNNIFIQEAVAKLYEDSVGVAGTDPKLLEKALQEYARAGELDPNNPVFNVKMAQIKRIIAASKTGQEQMALLTEAEDLLEGAIAKKKNFSVAYVSLGLTQEAKGERDAAMSSLQKAVDTDAKNLEAKFQLARLYRIKGGEEDLKKSEALLKSSLNQNDTSLNLHIGLGLTYEKMNRSEGAVGAYRKAIDLVKDDRFEEVRRQLQTMIDNVLAGRSNNDPVNVPSDDLSPPSEGAH